MNASNKETIRPESASIGAKIATAEARQIRDLIVTGFAAESSKRKWIGIDLVEDYLKGSEFRFSKIFRGN